MSLNKSRIKDMSNSKFRKDYVISFYPLAKALKIPTVNGKDYYEVWSDRIYLGKGKTAQNAWSAAFKNIND